VTGWAAFSDALTGWTALIYALIGPLIVLGIGWCSDHANAGGESFASRAVDEVANEAKIEDNCKNVMKRVVVSAVSVTGVIPSIVSTVTSVVGILGGLLDHSRGDTVTLFFILFFIYIVLVSVRPIQYVVTKSLYGLHNDVIDRNLETTNKTYLRYVDQYPVWLNVGLVGFAVVAFIIRNIGSIHFPVRALG